MKKLIIIPVYNESENIKNTVEKDIISNNSCNETNEVVVNWNYSRLYINACFS